MRYGQASKAQLGSLTIDQRRKRKFSVWKGIRRDYQLYLFILPALVYAAIFLYVPMYGVLIAFKDYKVNLGILNSPWVGLENFKIFFNSYSFGLTIKNTLTLSLYKLIAGFPIPIILALLLHHLPSKRYKKTVQLVSYAPHFISTVVLVGMINILLAPDTGIINIILDRLGIDTIFFMGRAELFRHIYVWSDIWKSAGWRCIIFIAALAGVDPTYYEAAIVDGATLWQRIKYIDLPSIMPTAVILLVLNVGQTMNLGFEKVYLMQNNANLHVSEIIETYVYRLGILGSNMELASAVGLFNSIINCILLVAVNRFSKKLTNSSLF